jgi:NADPH2:quinone reductase
VNSHPSEPGVSLRFVNIGPFRALAFEKTGGNRMKAIRVHAFGGPEVLMLEDVPDLHVGPKQVLVRVKAAGVNPTDTYTRAGTSRRPPLPYTPGIDGAGIVESVGNGVAGVKVGARVYLSGSVTGTYAEQVLCEEYQVHPLPDRVTFAQGAGVNIPYATAYRALFQLAKAIPGENVLVHGASGGVGVAAVQLARAAGMRVIGTGGSERGRKLATEQGAQHVLDHRAPNYLDAIQPLTQGHGVDVILEMLANVNLDRDLKTLAMRGRIVVIGSRGRIEVDPRDAMTRDASILGMLLFNITPEQAFTIHSALYAGLENGTLRPIIGKEIPLAEASRAHREVMAPGAYGKIVLIP